MIVVCELSSGRVTQPIRSIPTIDQALIIARTGRARAGLVWIEREEQPASRPTLAAWARSLLRDSRPRGTH